MDRESNSQEKTVMQQLREIRDKIGVETQDMSFDQLKKYIEERLILHPKSVWKRDKK
jgi:RNase adaptor protein for sRNA GlmZ degradation